MSALPEVSLPNVGPGPNPFTFPEFVAEEDIDFVLVLLQRDYYCTNCRKQVQAVRDRYEEFMARNAAVISVVPEPADEVAAWQTQYDLPFPLLADPEATVGDTYDQPVRFGFLGKWSDFLGRMPEAVLIDVRGDPEIVWTHRGSSTFDRPEIDDFLDRIDETQ
jgi:peroxiredoxin Q/BCP